MQTTPTVHILIATYNGELYLNELLKSIKQQSYPLWTITISDDGSTDNTIAIIENFSKLVENPISILQGPQKGTATANFFNLIAHAPKDKFDDLYAFCDQDDVWHQDKLERAVTWHTMNTLCQVRLYCGRTQIVDKDLKHLAYSPKIRNQHDFGNALIENIASGNTMVFNSNVITTLRKVHPDHSVWHDWTTYLVTTGIGGHVYFDNEPCLLYRQHENNVIGRNDSLLSLISTAIPNLLGRFKKRLDTNKLAVIDIYTQLSAQSRKTFKNYNTMMNSKSSAIRIIMFFKFNIKRRKLAANFAIMIAILFKII